MKEQSPKKEEKAKRFLKKAAEILEEQPEPAAPEDSAPKPAAKNKSGLSENRKRALINYMAILFSVAFLLVALSLGIQSRDSQNTASTAMEKADKLQEENRLLQEELQDLQEQLQILSEQFSDSQTALTQAQSEGDILIGANEELMWEKLDTINRASAYQFLVRAKSALDKGNLLAFQTAMTELADLNSYLDPVDLTIYQELLTAMSNINS